MQDWVCPRCQNTRNGRFCELDGYDSHLPGTDDWALVVTADRKYHAFVLEAGNAAAATIEFPEFCPERRFALRGDRLLIGRRSASRGIRPEIDLTGSPADPAVGHAHAELVRTPEGLWTVTDLDSANGTFVNHSETPIAPHAPEPIAPGDQITIGGWTNLTLRAG